MNGVRVEEKLDGGIVLYPLYWPKIRIPIISEDKFPINLTKEIFEKEFIKKDFKDSELGPEIRLGIITYLTLSVGKRFGKKDIRSFIKNPNLLDLTLLRHHGYLSSYIISIGELQGIDLKDKFQDCTTIGENQTWEFKDREVWDSMFSLMFTFNKYSGFWI